MTKASKVIFLDFDGVILTLRTCVSHDKRGWSNAPADPVLVNVLKRCCETGIRIVVSSTWRTHEETCKAKLRECGLIEFLHPDWRTAEFNSGEAALSRAVEIRDWIRGHQVEDYRILDDDDWLWTDKQKERFLKCDPEDGASARVLLSLLEFAGLRKLDVQPATKEDVARYTKGVTA